ncbi:two-component sensor histidine kinase [Oceanicola granulosus HTCC2516]|uniref:histidine kinase n=1 Tax=Oceanicola granulosus (strain ATCC BAA-861 / DSM 15982 / KCTC 12143 / HTCC2516) TaxID=314256 RepID=Q2CFM6_OCEGH|nr:GAF domain-containing sensor histidine kinase [Oceanicola granulosus]EAR51456.1 two-component sensor histidine kinase [Oceanicola granulosus HTCC2516]
MRTYPVPFNEDARVTAVHAVPGLTRENEPLFDAICTAAARLFDCPIAHVSVVEQSRQWYKSVVGIELSEMPKDNSFCTHTIMSGEPMVVPDLSRDPRFVDHPMVAEGGPQARFYAGVPLVLSSGFRFGSLCVLDFVPHAAPGEREMAALTALGEAVVAALEKAPAAAAEPAGGAAQDVFLSLVGHELRTPLTIVQGCLRMLEARAAGDVERKLAGSSMKAALHLSRLVTSILKFSDVRTGELQLDEAPVALGPLLEELYEDHALAMEEAGKTFRAPSCSLDAEVLLDVEHIRTCVTSLLLNSVLHGGGTIGTSLALDADGQIELRVSDDGRLDEHVELARLYEPFTVGGDLSERGTTGGLGLGLPLTRRLVELHGGEFEVLAEESGTTAIIRLPKWRLAARTAA